MKHLDKNFMEEFGLDAVDMTILDLRLNNPGISNVALASTLGYNVSSITDRQRSDRFKKAIAALFQAPLEIIKASLVEAATVLNESLKSVDERIRLKAAITILTSEGVLRSQPDEGGFKFEPLVIEVESSGRRIIHTDDLKNLPPGIEVKDD